MASALLDLPLFRREATPLLRREVMERDAYRCRYCGRPATELDHELPWSRGGLTHAGNLVAACFLCNHSKGDKTPVEWRRDQALARFGRLLAERRTRQGQIKANLRPRPGPPPRSLAAMLRG